MRIDGGFAAYFATNGLASGCSDSRAFTHRNGRANADANASADRDTIPNALTFG